MTLSELRTEIRQLTELYFTGATVRFAKQSFTVKADKPLVLLTVAPVSRPMNPPVKVIDGRPVAFYPASTTIQVDLFTNGEQREIAPGFTPVAENTAEDDLLAFASFLNSEYATQWCHKRDIAIVVPQTVQDVTGLVNDTNFEFRAMMEVTVYFTMTAIGYTGTLAPESVKHSGVNPDDGEPYETEGGDIQADDVTSLVPEFKQTASGGVNVELASEEDGYFTNVEINGKLVKEEQ
jgi:hypothetical protein